MTLDEASRVKKELDQIFPNKAKDYFPNIPKPIDSPPTIDTNQPWPTYPQYPWKGPFWSGQDL